MFDLDAIRARDAAGVYDGIEVHSANANFRIAAFDRRALLRYVDELLAATRKVKCGRCHGTSRITLTNTIDEVHDYGPCPDCSDLRRLLGESHG